MSHKGVHAAASVFSYMQEVRRELLELGTRPGVKGTPEGNQDIKLAQMLEDGKDAMKEKFTKLTLEDTDGG